VGEGSEAGSLKFQELAAMALHRNERGCKAARNRKPCLRCEEQETFFGSRGVDHSAGKGVEQGLQRFAAHGRLSGRTKKARKDIPRLGFTG